MNVTFLIGNGFDLNLGLKTQYSSFLESYTEVQKEDSELIKQFKSDILTTTDLWANAEVAFGEYTEFFVDHGRTAAEYCDCHENFCISLGHYLHYQEERLNFEALKSIVKGTFPKSISNYYQHFRETQRQQIDNYIKSIDGSFVYDFLSFNYTKTLDNCIRICKQPGILGKRTRGNWTGENTFGELLHVHGYTDREMILGVNDDSQIKSLNLFDKFGIEYISQIIKSKADEMNEENTEKKAKAILAKSDIIYIYGMSIGKTDAQWWQEICGLMNQKKSLHLIIQCFDAPQPGLIPRRYQTFAREKRNEFLSFSQDSKGKDQIMSRIHIDYTNIFESMCNLVDCKENLQSNQVGDEAVLALSGGKK